MSLRTATVVLALLCASGGSVRALEFTTTGPLGSADYVVDQDQPLSLLLLGRLSEKELWQSFQQSSSVISGAGVFLFPGVGQSGQVRIELWDGPPRSIPGSGKGERLAFADADGVPGQWVDVFWTPQAANQGLTYYLAFAGMGQGNQLAPSGAGDVYPKGNAYIDGESFPNFDATFRTYGPAIPEPASTLLLCAGLVLIGVSRRVRRRLFPR
jgi:hypothetical protein